MGRFVWVYLLAALGAAVADSECPDRSLRQNVNSGISWPVAVAYTTASGQTLCEHWAKEVK